jgi:hypothetical protein
VPGLRQAVPVLGAAQVADGHRSDQADDLRRAFGIKHGWVYTGDLTGAVYRAKP